MTATYVAKTQSTQSANPVGPGGDVMCYHGVAVPLLTSTSANNPGRKFYTCTKNRGDPDKCNFFKWADELPQASQDAAVSSQPKTPTKRLRAVTPTTMAFSPSNAGPSAHRYRYRPDPIEDDEEIVNLISDEETSRFLSAASGQPPAKKYMFNSTDETPGRYGAPRHSSGGESYPSSIMKTPTQKPSQWQAIRDDPENPFHAHAASVAQARPSEVEPLSSQATPVATGDPLQAAVDLLQSVPETVRRLERKLTATEKARDARAARIVQLQAEVEDLKDRNRSLEEAMETLKARR
ncbi:hypothetical protein JB92DRAFT_2901671 [Gautieria morchelliformis]|nr:hypothetical protein JB92DRAFT_2901671 [Gautieria morchelliformis]